MIGVGSGFGEHGLSRSGWTFWPTSGTDPDWRDVRIRLLPWVRDDETLAGRGMHNPDSGYPEQGHQRKFALRQLIQREKTTR